MPNILRFAAAMKAYGLAVVCGLSTVSAVQAEAPLPVKNLGSPAILIAEITEKVDAIGKSLESADAYMGGIDALKQNASLVAVLGQAVAEHPEESALKKSAPSLRAAAMVIARAKTYDDAKAAWPKLVAAAKGEAAVGDTVEFDWAKLSRMHPAMEEMSGRGSQFRRVLKRPKDPEADSRHLTAIAAIAISTYADTHEVKNPDDLPQWREWATQLHTHMSQAAAAVRAKEMDKAGELFNQGMATCKTCHEKFKH